MTLKKRRVNPVPDHQRGQLLKTPNATENVTLFSLIAEIDLNPCFPQPYPSHFSTQVSDVPPFQNQTQSPLFWWDSLPSWPVAVQIKRRRHPPRWMDRAVMQSELPSFPRGKSWFWKSVHYGAEKAAKELGNVEIIRGPVVESDTGSQIEVVKTMITSQVDGIVLAPNQKGVGGRRARIDRRGYPRCHL